jgi:hypothetical protein
MARGDAREGKWRGSWRMQWVASTLHTTSERGVYSITTADAHTSGCQQSTELTPTSADLNGLVRFARKTKSGFCACAITFQLQAKVFAVWQMVSAEQESDWDSELVWKRENLFAPVGNWTSIQRTDQKHEKMDCLCSPYSPLPVPHIIKKLLACNGTRRFL